MPAVSHKSRSPRTQRVSAKKRALVAKITHKILTSPGAFNPWGAIQDDVPGFLSVTSRDALAVEQVGDPEKVMAASLWGRQTGRLDLAKSRARA